MTLGQLRRITADFGDDLPIHVVYYGPVTAWRIEEAGTAHVRLELTTEHDVNVVRDGWHTP